MAERSVSQAGRRQGLLKRAGSLLVLMALAWALGPLAAAGADFEITRYDIQLAVAPDNSYQVTETLDVRFFKQQHGIFRDIPVVTYRGHSVTLEDVRVPEEPFEMIRQGRQLRLRIGDPDAYAPMENRYTLSYRYIIGDDRLKDMDEVYFNLIGTGWEVPIGKVTFAVTLPAPFDAQGLRFTHGPEGSKESGGVAFRTEGLEIRGELAGGLRPREALTMALPLPEGYFTEAVLLETPYEWLGRFSWAALGLLTAAGAGLWAAFGKNRPLYSAPAFYPPEELNPAEMGYVFDGKVNPYDISSLLVYWADRGFLRIEERETEPSAWLRRRKRVLYLIRRQGLTEGSPHELFMFEALFREYARGDEVCVEDLEESFYVRAREVEAMLRREMDSGPKGPVFEPKGWVVVLALGLLAVLCGGLAVLQLLLAFGAAYGPLPWIFGLLGGFVVALPLMGFATVLHDWQTLLPRRRLGALAAALTATAVLLGATAFLAYEADRIPQVAGALCGTFLLSLLAADGIRRTPRGDDYTARILGFRDFLLHAEKDRIEALAEESPAYFYHVLPYAMVLGVTDQWARRFEGIALTPPEWYGTDGGFHGTFSPTVFSRALSTDMMTMAGALKSAPDSGGTGGSSGGGSSGGGSGGGGGGSW